MVEQVISTKVFYSNKCEVCDWEGAINHIFLFIDVFFSHKQCMHSFINYYKIRRKWYKIFFTRNGHLIIILANGISWIWEKSPMKKTIEFTKFKNNEWIHNNSLTFLEADL